MERQLTQVRPGLKAGMVLLTALLFAASSCDEDGGDKAPSEIERLKLAFVEVSDSEASTLILVADNGESSRVELGEGIGVLALSCRRDGKVLLGVTRGARLLPPLLVEDGEGAFLRAIPSGRSPSWVDDDSFLWQTTNDAGQPTVGLYGLDGEVRGPMAPGSAPNYLAGRNAVAVSRGIGVGVPEPGIYLVEIEGLSRAEPSLAEAAELVSRIPFNPIQLDPDARRFVLTTAAMENNQRDVQTVDVSGAGLRTLTATAEQEQTARWTSSGDLVFVREQLRDQGSDGDQPIAAEVVLLEVEPGVETVLAEGTGIDLLAPCNQAPSGAGCGLGGGAVPQLDRHGLRGGDVGGCVGGIYMEDERAIPGQGRD